MQVMECSPCLPHIFGANGGRKAWLVSVQGPRTPLLAPAEQPCSRAGDPCSPRLAPRCPGRSSRRRSGEGRCRGRWGRCRRPAGFRFRGARPETAGRGGLSAGGMPAGPARPPGGHRASGQRGEPQATPSSVSPRSALRRMDRGALQFPAKGKRLAFQPHPEATTFPTKPSGHCHVCEK